jgi:5'-nucleotidase
MIVLVDMDGVVADFETGFYLAWSQLETGFPAIPVADRMLPRVRDQYPSHLAKLVKEICQAPGFYSNLPAIPGAIAGVLSMLEQGHQVAFCTSPLTAYRNCVLEKFEWIEQHFGAGFTDRIVMTKDKTLVTGDVLIDDQPHIQGLLVPTWQHVIYTQPYNLSAIGPRMDWVSWKDSLAGL